ncbi:hypothetical protein GCM10022247_19000 [Allokutzneria multivorans]|uniref:Secreted protein n=1 Tax=Allokutzneria multivorans TaxID=1142134 RepID=A0ABP7RKX5_9PSEU
MRRFVLAALPVLVASVLWAADAPVAQSSPQQLHAQVAAGEQPPAELDSEPVVKLAPDAAPVAWTMTSSCSQWASVIRQGANYWGGGRLVERAGGVPVRCQTSYITNCGVARAVGCNYGGSAIALMPNGTRSPGVLAAHEFGHFWYGHSSGCASWNNVMGTPMCN